jgi:Carboxypeptidase regulatory-like domain
MQSTPRCSFPAGPWLIRIVLLIGMITGLHATLVAQMDQGTITGVVLDNTGAVVPGAAVSLTSVDTGLTLNATTDGSGVYTFSPVQIGNYKLSAKAAGFSTAVQDNVHLSIQQRLELNLQLKPGTATPDGRSDYRAPVAADAKRLDRPGDRCSDDQRNAAEWTQLGLYRATDRWRCAGKWRARSRERRRQREWPARGAE